MRTLTFSLSLFVLSLLFWALPLQAQEEENPFVGKKATEVQDLTSNLTWFNRTDSKSSFNDFKGQVLVLEFSAVWCGPCIASIPHLKQIQDKLGPLGVEIVSVFTPDNNPPLEKILSDHQVTYRVARDVKQELFKGYKIQSFPQVYVIDSLGVLAWHGHPMELEEAFLVYLSAQNLPTDNGDATLAQGKKWIEEEEYLKARELLTASSAKSTPAYLNFLTRLAEGEARGFSEFQNANNVDKCAIIDYYEKVFEKFGQKEPALQSVKTAIEAFKSSPEYDIAIVLFEQEKAAQEAWKVLQEKASTAYQRGEDISKFKKDFEAYIAEYGASDYGKEVRTFLQGQGLLD
jgi:thiol-disulfide isomerase/thioredoxin